MYLGIDPGRQKFGWAITDEGGSLLASGVTPSEALELFVQGVAQNPDDITQWLIEGTLPSPFRVRKVFCGDGTGHARFLRILLDWGLDVQVTDEVNTTLEARALFWKIHPPKGFWRLIPVTLRTPPRCIDDLAACCIIRRALGVRLN